MNSGFRRLGLGGGALLLNCGSRLVVNRCCNYDGRALRRIVVGDVLITFWAINCLISLIIMMN